MKALWTHIYQSLEVQGLKSLGVKWKTDVKFITSKLMYFRNGKLMITVGLEV